MQYNPDCFYSKLIYGKILQTQVGHCSVSSAVEHSPARFSRLIFGDEIIAFGFVHNNKLEFTKYAIPDKVALERAASSGKTLVLALHRSKTSRV